MSFTQKKASRIFAILLGTMMVFAMIPSMAFAAVHGDIDIYIPDGENLSLSYVDGTTDPYTFNVVSSVSGYHPTNFSLYVKPSSDDALIDSIEGKDGASITQLGTTDDDYYLVTPSTTQESYIEIRAKKYGEVTVYKVNCDIPDGGSGGTVEDEAVVAYLPAPGQFTNEGVTAGGWGDIFASNGELKHNASTGVSLGYFGGYYVYDFGQNIMNSSSNPYGADFIVYGNAFWGNSEPGCIQVSEDGSTWYDIAGSRYYNEATVKNYSLTYTNPTPTDDTNNTTAGNNLGTKADVNYTGSDSGSVLANPFHSHSYFPLNCNYFVARNGLSEDMAKTNSYSFADYTEGDANNGASLTLTGVMLGGITTTSNTESCGFGYCDVHPNKDLGGTIAYNPYQAFSGNSDYNTKVAGTSGGDPIDISWAVDSDGAPVNLDKIRYVRIYTGTAAMNGMFGEISTEVLGVAACTGDTGSETTSDLAIYDSTYNPVSEIYNMGVKTINVSGSDTYYISSTDSNIYLNGERVSNGETLNVSLEANQVAYYQIISQNEAEEPFITVLKFVGTN